MHQRSEENAPPKMNWESALSAEVEKPYFRKLAEFVKERRKVAKVFPESDKIFRALESVEFEQIKVVILGQDPYHGEGQANGLAFSVNENTELPPSLKNIFTEINTDIDPGYTTPCHGELTRWTEQGVLLLNTILTVEEDKPGSHANRGWETFTDTVVKQISSNREHVVFLLWGNFARSRAQLVNKDRHLVLESVHPSPLSAYRGFFGCKHFSKANEYLRANNIKPIRW